MRTSIYTLIFSVFVSATAWPQAAGAADLAYVKQLQKTASSLHLEQSRMWQVLLHYRKTWTGGWRSEADGLGFFNAGKSGRTDPAAELNATLLAFAQPAPPSDAGKSLEDAQHPQCRFPARWSWLKETLQIDPARMPDQPCPYFAMWRQAFAAQKVNLVYAAAYVNSPASMYGHTFLRLTRSTGEGNPLLDYIINYAADVDTKNGLVYAFKGVLGGFRGRFYAMPYYVKIQEYSNMESRDLWEYELSLTPAQSERLVQHTWETRSTHFDYYFFTENCSYFLLGLLEAADPRLHLVDEFWGTTIPANTVRAVLNVPGLVRSNAPRPSLRATMFAQKRALNARQMDAANALANTGKAAATALAALPKVEQARIIDAGYARLRYKEGFTWPPTPSFEKKERELLVLRGRTGVPPQTVAGIDFVDAPERGHRTLRLAAGGGSTFDAKERTAGVAFADVSMRFAIHDYLDDPQGYPEDASLEMVSLRLRLLVDSQRFFIERLTLLNIVSAAPVDRWLISPSWKVWAGGGQAHELGCAGWDCSFGGVTSGGGFAWRPWRPWLLFAMGDLQVQGGSIFAHNFRAGLGGSLGSTIRWGRVAQTELGAQYIQHLVGDTRNRPLFSFGHAFNLGSRMQARIVAESFGRVVFSRAELVAYF
ncbi:MAG: DUF4105 domain-containing protein [Deltaproteobacteria bacterium]|nr:DUF4105 domain-containing protein [Deltaproteobacteria bacterium]